ncbi:UvrB/UvrC motif-containing protein [Roseibacillus persicicus]|uniref:UvrB/UvrC motif-containing protein n=1 Tax=Roseibacillus persicicus TaxID=454148 RepID=UPI00280DA53F|nr:UvrB/UvrC motif-containing protein [Roseibacillus persicicus]MDQ8189053.1 UvrB/UvrC motif-containing protein [Roseibacillus persicicus]
MHFTQLENGQMNKMSFCESCAAAEGIMDLSGFGLADSVLSAGSDETKGSDNGDQCPGCGFTRSKFQQTGRLGCSQCYLTFSDDILARLGPMHRGLRHLGKHPEGFTGDAFSERLLAECEERLAEAVAAENYEEAARIRDEIRQLSQTLESVPTSSEVSAENGDSAP